jgi:hypothetical protein
VRAFQEHSEVVLRGFYAVDVDFGAFHMRSFRVCSWVCAKWDRA